MTTRKLFFVTMLLGSACARDVGTGSKASPTDAPQAEHTAVAPAGADAKIVDASHAHDGEHAGCIYADGEKGEHAECDRNAEPDAPKQSSGHFGAPFAAAEPTPLATALAAGKPGLVLVSGTVEAVCQKKGCWMVVKDGTESARVMMKDHAFAVPIDARGKAVLVEGEITSRTFDEAQVKHLEQDKGGDPDKVAGARKEHVLMATGVKIQS
jgi:uncharacterized protein DUF4920